MITQQRLKQVLKYSPETGVFRWRIPKGKIKAGTVAGCTNNDGYRKIAIDGKGYLAHRLAWMYITGEFPSTTLTHDNFNRADNSWKNILQTAQIYNPIMYKKATLSSLKTRVAHLQVKIEVAELELESMGEAP